MKLKTNSKPISNHPNKISCLLSDPKKSIKKHSIPSNHNSKCERLELPNLLIENLDGIENYQHLTHLNLNHNTITDFTQLENLKKCSKLKYLSILENPIT
jgi:hypothetical protein